MNLVICSPTDTSAIWAHHGLRSAGFESELVTTDTLAFTTAWEHRVGTTSSSISFTLPGGRIIDGTKASAVLNRLAMPPQNLVSHAVPEDRDYAMQELTAFYLSWLESLPGIVVNRPTPQGLCGRWRHASEWAILAHQAGLRVPAFRHFSSDPADSGYGSIAPPGTRLTRTIVFDNEVFGAVLPDKLRDACVKLAALAEASLLGVDLYQDAQSTWMFAAATPMPELELGGLPLLSRMARVFQNGGGK